MAAVGPKSSGPPCRYVTTTKATYMPIMTNSPCAKLMTFIIPQMSVSPDENSA